MPTGDPVSTSPPLFDDASREVVTYLRDALPIGTWTITRFDGERQVYLTVDDTDLGLTEGASVLWSDSMCQYSAVGTGVTIVTDPQNVAEYAAKIAKSGLPVGSYVGYPLTTSDGKLFGTLCGFGRDRVSPEVEQNQNLITLLASLLSRVLEADLHATAAARELEAAQRSADTDALTGLINRNGWQRLLDVENARFRRFGDPGAIIVVDLDDLKTVNDTSGHHAGDDHLRRTARMMSQVIDGPGIVARIGGDEFAALLSGVGAAAVHDVVVRLRTALMANNVSASLGCSIYSMSEGLDGAWRAADKAMYAEKIAKRAPGPNPTSRGLRTP